MNIFMTMKDLVKIGSDTAKGGFANEKDICKKFNDWKKDRESQLWLEIMGYNIDKLDSVEVVQIPPKGQKADVQLKNHDYNWKDDKGGESIVKESQ